jgi:hypothetical protein
VRTVWVMTFLHAALRGTLALLNLAVGLVLGVVGYTAAANDFTWAAIAPALPVLYTAGASSTELHTSARGVVYLEARLSNNRMETCSGFLVDDRTVATAAHCVVGVADLVIVPAFHRENGHALEPYGGCTAAWWRAAPEYVASPELADGSDLRKVGAAGDFAAVGVGTCPSTPANPAGTADIGQLVGTIPLSSGPAGSWRHVTTTHLSYPGSAPAGTLRSETSHGTVVTCAVPAVCVAAPGVAVGYFQVEPGCSGGVLTASDPVTGVTAAVGVLSGMRGRQSVFHHFSAADINQYRTWVEMYAATSGVAADQ